MTTRRMLLILGLLLPCEYLATGASVAAEADVPRLLLHLRFEGGALGFGTIEQTLVFSDGLLVTQAEHMVFGHGNPRDRIEMLRRKAPEDATGAFLEALEEHDVATVQGPCRLGYTRIPETATTDVTWFGEGGARHTFTVVEDFEQDEPDCPERTAAIFEAITALQHSAAFDLGASVVALPRPGIGDRLGRLLLLHEGRFAVTADWRDAGDRRGLGRVVADPTEDSGLFVFFDEDNWELMVKVLDGCALNGHYWVFLAAATDVEVTVRIEDRVNDRVWSRTQPLGVFSEAVGDTLAFACEEHGKEFPLVAAASAATTSLESAPARSSSAVALSTAPLLQIDEVHFDPARPRGRPGLRTSLVFRDGLVVEQEERPGAPPVLRRSAASVESLVQELEAQGIASLRGDCRDEGAPPGELLVTRLAWFAEPVDRFEFQGNILTVSSSSPRPCPPGTLAVIDAGRDLLAEARSAPGTSEVELGEAPPDDLGQALLLGGGRFAVTVDARDFEDRATAGRVAAGATDESAVFWFFDPQNWELMVKVLDGCALNGHYWVFGAGATNVEHAVRVEDRDTGRIWTFDQPSGSFSPAFGDVLALPCQ